MQRADWSLSAHDLSDVSAARIEPAADFGPTSCFHSPNYLKNYTEPHVFTHGLS